VNHSIVSMMRLSVLSGLSLICIQQSVSQDTDRRIGIGVQLSTPPPFNYNLMYSSYSALPTQQSLEMPPDVLISCWLTDEIALEPSVGLLAFSNETQWRLGLTIINHFGTEKLRPFVLVGGKAYLSSSTRDIPYTYSNATTTSFLFALGTGGEYFVGDKFSVSGECHLSYLIPDKSGTIYLAYNTLSTGVGLACRFYLK